MRQLIFDYLELVKDEAFSSIEEWPPDGVKKEDIPDELLLERLLIVVRMNYIVGMQEDYKREEQIIDQIRQDYK